MSYFKADTSVLTKDEKEIAKLILNKAEIEPEEVKLEKRLSPKMNNIEFDKFIKDISSNDNIKNLTVQDWKYPIDAVMLFVYDHFPLKPIENNPNTIQTPRMVKNIKKACALSTRLVLRSLFSLIVGIPLTNFTVSRINKHMKNKALYNWMMGHINKVYTDHPEYSPVSIPTFKKANVFQKIVSEWRDTTIKEDLSNLSDKAFDTFLMVICERLPFYAGFLYAIPAKMLLTYLGCRMGVGSIYTLVVDIEGNSVTLGLCFTRLGFILSAPKLYVSKDHRKLVRVNLPEIPRSIYSTSVKDAKAFLDNYGDSGDLKELKKEVSKWNDTKQ